VSAEQLVAAAVGFVSVIGRHGRRALHPDEALAAAGFALIDLTHEAVDNNVGVADLVDEVADVIGEVTHVIDGVADLSVEVRNVIDDVSNVYGQVRDLAREVADINVEVVNVIDDVNDLIDDVGDFMGGTVVFRARGTEAVDAPDARDAAECWPAFGPPRAATRSIERPRPIASARGVTRRRSAPAPGPRLRASAGCTGRRWRLRAAPRTRPACAWSTGSR